MGWPPEQVAATSLWRFTEALRGWRKANGGDEEDRRVTPADLAAFYERNGIA